MFRKRNKWNEVKKKRNWVDGDKWEVEQCGRGVELIWMGCGGVWWSEGCDMKDVCALNEVIVSRCGQRCGGLPVLTWPTLPIIDKC